LKGADTVAYTLADYLKLNKNYTSSYDPTTKKATLTNSKTGKSINFTSGQGQQYGLGSVVNGSNTIDDIDKLTSYLEDTSSKSNTTNTSSTLGTSNYSSPYSQNILDTLSTIQNSKFSYDPDEDEDLQNAQDEAMDAVSRAAARRGMLYSSSDKAQMSEAAADLVPTYKAQAYTEYQNNLNNLLSQLSTYQNLDQSAISNYTNTLGAYANDYQAQINALTNDNDTSNDWQIPYLNAARNEKISGQATSAADAQQQAFENELALYKAQKTSSGSSSGNGSSSGTLKVSDINSLYNSGLIDDATAASLLSQLGVGPTQQNYVSEVEKLLAQRTVPSSQVALIEAYNKQGKLTDEEATALLKKYGLTR